MRYQFMGSLAGDSAAMQKWKGSIDLQYCQQSFDLPSIAGLTKLQSLLQFEFKRKDILVPLIFGKEWGERGRFGSFAIVAAWNYSMISYGSDILKLVQKFDSASAEYFC